LHSLGSIAELLTEDQAKSVIDKNGVDLVFFASFGVFQPGKTLCSWLNSPFKGVNPMTLCCLT
jgi:hypothetical protein